MGLGKFFKKAVNFPAKLVGKTVYRHTKSITGSEKMASAVSRVMSVSTSALGGDPLPFRKTMTASDVGSKNPSLFLKGRQAGDIFGISVGSLFVGGALLGGVGATGGGAGGAAAASGGTVATGGTAVAGSGTAIATGAGASTSWWSTGAAAASGLIGAVGSLFKGIAGPALSEKASQFFNEVLGGSGGAGSSPGGSGGEGGGTGGILSSSKLPFILIGLVLLGAFLLSRKKGK